MEIFLYLIVILALLCIAIYITNLLAPAPFNKWLVVAWAACAFLALLFHYIIH